MRVSRFSCLGPKSDRGSEGLSVATNQEVTLTGGT